MRFYCVVLLTSILSCVAAKQKEVGTTHFLTVKKSPRASQLKKSIQPQVSIPQRKEQQHYFFHSGSLKANITQLAQQFGWNHTVWLPHYDFNWVGTTELTGNTLEEILANILNDYPLQAVFYQGNHVLVVTTRNIP